MRRNLLKIGVLYLTISILLLSCTKENQIQKSASDSLKTETGSLPVKADTINNSENVKTDSVSFLIEKKDSSSLKKKNIKIIAYYFHPTARCPSCINIENFTKEVIETEFSKENNKRLISFKQLNIDDSVNEHYIEDYKLENSSVILARYVDNKQVNWKNLEHVWKYAMDKESFFKYMKIEIKDFLKEKNGAFNG